jgi:hypothetical protein
MFDEMHGEILNGLDGILAREGIDGVLHRVRGEDPAVVAFAVRRFEIACEADAQREFLYVMAAFLTKETKKANALLAVIVFSQADGHASAPPIRGVAIRA